MGEILSREEQIELLKSSVKEWNKWRAANPSVKIDLQNVDLSETECNGAYLFNADLKGAFLSKAHLLKANLGAANLFEADLRGANLSKAILVWANFSLANLSGANLSEANLGNANLTKANLNNAVLKLAMLAETNIAHTDLYKADFTDAICSCLGFREIDLTHAKNLAKVKHLDSSFIDIDTLRQSKGQIPLEFLRGCGMADWEIECYKLYRKDLTSNQLSNITYKIHELRNTRPNLFYSVFISYNHGDKEFAQKLHDRLQDDGIRCWMDKKQLFPGDDIYEEVDKGIKLWDKVLLCCSENSLTSWWLDNEINKAFRKEQDIMKERKKKTLALIPLDLDGYLFNGWENGKKDQVCSRLAADFKDWKTNENKFNAEFKRVKKALLADGSGREKAPKPLL